VVLCNSNDDPEIEREYLKLLQGMRIDGLIVTPTSRNRTLFGRLLQKDIAIIQVDRKVEGLAADAILVDNEAGAHAAVQHLIAAGHTNIGILPGDLDVPTAGQRLAGYERALEEAGIPIREELVKAGSFHRDHAIEDAADLIRAHPTPTAIFAANNILAEATLIVLAELDLKVPHDLSLVAFDDVQWMGMVNPPVTTVRQPVADLARGAAELMLRRLREESQGPPSTIVFRTELLERGSIAPARKVKAASTR
jgi:LacI family transcriptional regulator